MRSAARAMVAADAACEDWWLQHWLRAVVPIPNSDIAGVFDQIADLLELQGENPFRIRAYRTAARAVGEYPRDLGNIVVAAEKGTAAEGIDRFCRYDDVTQVRARGDTRSTVVLRNGVQADLRVVAPESYGAALHYFTGSKASKIRSRSPRCGRCSYALWGELAVDLTQALGRHRVLC